MGSPWKALSDDNRREILLLLGKKDSMIPTEISEHFKSDITCGLHPTPYSKGGRYDNREKTGKK